MVAMIEQASEVANNRGDKHIGIEDILFLLRKDKDRQYHPVSYDTLENVAAFLTNQSNWVPESYVVTAKHDLQLVKLKRLLRYYEVRDLKNVIKGTLATSEDVTGKAELGIASLQEKQALDARTMGKNRQICYNFLSTIDQTGELVALFDDKEIDTVKHERMLRAEMMSQGLDTEQYMEFCQARQASFCRRYKIQHFRDWLQINPTPDIVLSATAVEIFSYLAYETVAQIVDLALLVKQDMRGHPGDPLSKARPALCVNYTELYAGSFLGKPEATTAVSQSPPYDSSNTSQINSAAITTNIQISAPVTPSKLSNKQRKKSGPPTKVEVSWDCTILPSDVREAMRRYFTDISPFASQNKINHHCSPWYRTLCS